MRVLNKERAGFTLAEVLIVLGVVGVVAALTLPTLISNVSERVRNEHVKIFKYKFASATSKMNASGDMHEYNSTEEFLNAFSKHFKIISTCDNSNLENCWPSKTINLPNADGDIVQNSVSDIKTGQDLRAFALGTKNTNTVGILSADGVPMILVYSPRCQMDEAVKGMASTSCISAVYDINGASGPNRLGVDVRTINSLYGAVNLGQNYTSVPSSFQNNHICRSVRRELGVPNVPCPHDVDNAFLGAMKACHDLKLHSPSRETLAFAAGAMFGITDLGINENINCANNYCWNQPAGRTSPKDSESVEFSGTYWTDTPFIFRYTNNVESVTMSCNAGCTNMFKQSALCVGD